MTGVILEYPLTVTVLDKYSVNICLSLCIRMTAFLVVLIEQISECRVNAIDIDLAGPEINGSQKSSSPVNS